MAKAYGIRTDLNKPKSPLPVQTAPSNQYGEAKRLREAQRAVPMGAPPTDMQARKATKNVRKPVALDAPTARPSEPITAGMDFGPGPGRMAIGLPSVFEERRAAAVEIAQIASAFQTEDLMDMVSRFGGRY
jgi:hypothetical protein